jgi:hypothetical protein
LVLRFLLYGLIGWCAEILWSGLYQALLGDSIDWSLPGSTHLWMFPLYSAGGVFVFEPLHNSIRRWPWALRAALYVPVLFVIAYLTRWVLCGGLGYCPATSSTGEAELVGLHYAPLLFVLGLLLERLHNWLIELSLARRLLIRRRSRRRPIAARPERRSNTLRARARRRAPR